MSEDFEKAGEKENTEAPFDFDSEEEQAEQEMDQFVRAAVDAMLHEYVGRWQKLVSTTNWDKGRIICQWRDALVDAGAPATVYSDQSWANLVGNVTPQHVGRLRRVYTRFGDFQDAYPGLFWSHFQAALDWDDADQWLDNAQQCGWSVSKMRSERWQANGSPADSKPRDEDIVTSEMDEDVDPRDDSDDNRDSLLDETRDTMRDAGDFGDDDDDDSAPFDADADRQSLEAMLDGDDRPPARIFESVGDLPSDLSDALESMKVAIIHHRLSGWQEVSCDDVLTILKGLQKLALQDEEAVV